MEQWEWWVGGGEGRGEERRRGVLERSPIHLQITIALDEKINPPPLRRLNGMPPYGVNELPEVCSEFPVSLIGKSTIAFFLGAYSNPGTQMRPRTKILALILRRT